MTYLEEIVKEAKEAAKLERKEALTRLNAAAGHFYELIDRVVRAKTKHTRSKRYLELDEAVDEYVEAIRAHERAWL